MNGEGGMKRGVAVLSIVAAAIAAFALPARAAGTFAGWAAIVVAGDWHSHSGAPSQVFDNARRDVAAAFEHIGVSPANLVQFTAQPDLDGNPDVQQSNAQNVADTLWDLSNRTSAGCLVYFSSHGSPDGILLGDSILSPDQLESMLNNSCATRPTVVILSACFSGVFVPELAGPNRFVMTAARPDRTSFGCGDNDRYPYFDACVLQSLPASTGFPILAKEAEGCVAQKERQDHLSPPSDPQIFVGMDILPELPHWR